MEKSVVDMMDHEKGGQKIKKMISSKLRTTILLFIDSEESSCWTVECYY